MNKKEHIEISKYYSQTISGLQKLVDEHHDIVTRACDHVINHHKGLLKVQIDEIKQIEKFLVEILVEIEDSFNKKDTQQYNNIKAMHKELKIQFNLLNDKQINRIIADESKTRLSILYYSIMRNFVMLSKHSLKLMEIFMLSLNKEDDNRPISDFDID